MHEDNFSSLLTNFPLCQGSLTTGFTAFHSIYQFSFLKNFSSFFPPLQFISLFYSRDSCVIPQGFAVSLHPPNERPQVYKRYYYIPLQQSVILRVSPNIMDAESSVLAHDLNVRKCYLRAEHPLQFYNQYTRQNCRRECLSRITLDRCGCVKFFMLRMCFFNSRQNVSFLRSVRSFSRLFRIKWYKDLWTRKNEMLQ